MATTQLLTAEQLWEKPEEPGKRFELVRGELVEMPGTGAEHGTIAMEIIAALLAFVRPRTLGRVYAGDVTYILARNPDTLRIPDVSFVAQERIAQHGIPKGYWPFPPDLAVEIVSPNDRADAVGAKVDEYLAAGVRLVWVVWPDTSSVMVYTLDEEPREYSEGDTLDGGEVLPGFSVLVRDLFTIEQ